jgi:hypothetical protein
MWHEGVPRRREQETRGPVVGNVRNCAGFSDDPGRCKGQGSYDGS